MLVYGPIIFGLIIGFILGTRFRSSEYFTTSSLIMIFIIAILMAWQLGNFPYYTDLPIATGFVAAAIGIIFGKLIFGRTKTNN